MEQQKNQPVHWRKSNHKRVTTSYTDTIQDNNSIKAHLVGYTKVKDIKDVPLRSHLRYITWKNNRQRFCLGGFLKTIEKEYVTFQNKDTFWHVQKKHYDQFDDKKLIFETVFFVKDKKAQITQQSEQPQINVGNSIHSKDIKNFRKQIKKKRQRNEKLQAFFPNNRNQDFV